MKASTSAVLPPISVAIVEDNAAVSSSLQKVLANSGGKFVCVGVYATAEEGLENIPKKKPDVVLMDIELPNMSGIACTAHLKRLIPEVQILILTVYNNSQKIFRALEAGASGYLLKRSAVDELLQAIREVKEGGSPMSTEIAREVVKHFHKPPAHALELESLSAREEEVLALLAEGYTNKEIASKLFVDYETVCSHLKHIYQKLHVRSRSEAIIKFLG